MNRENKRNGEITMNSVNSETIGRISEIRKNSFTIRYEGKDFPGKLKGQLL